MRRQPICAASTASARRCFTRGGRSMAGWRRPTPSGGAGLRRRTPNSRSCWRRRCWTCRPCGRCWQKLVTPGLRRPAVAWAMEHKGCSRRRARNRVGIEPKTCRCVSRRPDDGAVRDRLRVLAGERRRFGYRRLVSPLRGQTLLARDGVRLNHKRLFRLHRGWAAAGPRSGSAGSACASGAAGSGRSARARLRRCRRRRTSAGRWTSCRMRCPVGDGSGCWRWWTPSPASASAWSWTRRCPACGSGASWTGSSSSGAAAQQ